MQAVNCGLGEARARRYFGGREPGDVAQEDDAPLVVCELRHGVMEHAVAIETAVDCRPLVRSAHFLGGYGAALPQVVERSVARDLEQPRRERRRAGLIAPD